MTLPQIRISLAPSVLFAAGEIYQRRNETTSCRVVGAIFGNVVSKDESKSGRIEVNISTCFAVPHSEVGDQISINSEYYKIRSELVRKCYGKSAVILGWFSIAEESFESQPKNTEFINDSFGREVLASGSLPYNIHLDLLLGTSGIKKSVTVTDASKKQVIDGVSFGLDFLPADIFASMIILIFASLHHLLFS